MLEAAGWIDTTWLTEESSERGKAVHAMTAAYDLDALDLKSCRSPYRGWLAAHDAAMRLVRPRVLEVELPTMHALHRFGGRPDRLWQLDGFLAVVDLKSGSPAKSHPIQTALQAILKGPELGLVPEGIRRYGLYLTERGRFELRPHTDQADYLEAYKVIREYAR